MHKHEEVECPGQRPDDELPTTIPPSAAEPLGHDPSHPAQAPFYQLCPVTFWFALLLAGAYGLTSYPLGFQGITQQAALWGAFIPEAIREGEWWRVYTAALLHANPTHLLANLFGVLAFGNLLEPVIGSRRLLALYFVSETGGLMLSMAMMPVVSIGASSIDYGLIGTYIGLILLLHFRQDRQVFWRSLRSALAFMILFVMSNTLELATINLWAHLGGFLSGLLFAVLLFRPRQSVS